ncbi:MAG: transposase [Bacteroidales bacterium]|nr:transposase [Bacteroidales bacterium]
MSQSLSKLYVHIIYHVKTTSVKIRKENKKDLYAYIGSIIKDKDSIPILINGTEDHVHILCVMSKNIALAKLVEEIKGNSSRWIKTFNLYYENFAWQGGYGGFSVSPSLHDKTKRYIENQEEHHKKMSFQGEYLMFLKEYEIEYNEQYLWTD